MLEFNKSYSDSKIILDELLLGSGVVLFKDVFLHDQINEAREIVNKYADNHDEKETHFNSRKEIPINERTLQSFKLNIVIFSAF